MDFLNSDSLPTELRDAIYYKNLAIRQTLFFQGDATWAIFAVESGQISLVRYTESGQAIKHYGLKSGESFAQAALFNLKRSILDNTIKRSLNMPTPNSPGQSV